MSIRFNLGERVTFTVLDERGREVATYDSLITAWYHVTGWLPSLAEAG